MDHVPVRIRIMQPIAIMVSEEDLEAAKRLGNAMFPAQGTVEARHVLGTAARLGIEQLKLMYGLKEEK